MTAETEKQQIRTQMKAYRNSLDGVSLLEKGASIRERIETWEVYQKAQSILFYAFLPGEPDLDGLAQAALGVPKRVLFPVIDVASGQMTAVEINDLDQLEKSTFGVREPKRKPGGSLEGPLDLVLVPGLAFTKMGCRLGRGGGYYDAFLSAIDSQTVTAGIAFAGQLVDELPMVGGQDMKVQYVITEEGIHG